MTIVQDHAAPCPLNLQEKPMDTKRIITQAYYSSATALGGSDIYLGQLIRKCIRDGRQVVLFCPQAHPFVTGRCFDRTEVQLVFTDNVSSAHHEGPARHDESPPDAEHLKQKPGRLRSLWRKLPAHRVKILIGTIKEVIRLKRMFQKHPVDLIHFNDTGCEPPVIAARLAGIRQIVGTYHVAPDDRRQDWVTRLIEFASVRCMDMGIAVSEATKKAWVDRTGLCPDRIKVVYNGIDLARFSQNNRQATRQQLGLPEDGQVILVPARLHWSKGHEILLNAFPRIVNAQGRARLLFLGDGDLRGHLENIVARLGLEGQVMFLGFRDHPADYYFASDLVCLPAFALDALPYSLIEAMACGRPVVASRFAGIPEIVDDGATGFLVPPRDPEALADAIIRLLQDETLRKQMGAAGRARAGKLFTEERMLKESFGVYGRLLGCRLSGC